MSFFVIFCATYLYEKLIKSQIDMQYAYTVVQYFYVIFLHKAE